MQQSTTFSENFPPERLRSNSYDFSHTKRMRTGSISGRLRTASDLEELGFIDKRQKGLIKDLIISGDKNVQDILDRYAQGEKSDIMELLKQDFLGHKESIDLLDGLDFDFINGLRDEEVPGYDHPLDDGQEMSHLQMQQLLPRQTYHPEEHQIPHPKTRRDSIDNLFTNELINIEDYDVGVSNALMENVIIGGDGSHDDDIFNTFEKEDDELQHFHHSHRSNSLDSVSSATSPQNRSVKKSLRLATAAVNYAMNPSEGEEANVDVDLSAYANYAAQLQNNKENQQQLYSTVGGGSTISNKKKTSSPSEDHNKLLLKLKPSSNNVAHIPTIGNPYAATTTPTTSSVSEKMNRFGLRGPNTMNNNNTMITTIGGGSLKIPTVSNSMYSPAVAVTIGGALKPINVPNTSDSLYLSSGNPSSSSSQHPIISSLGDHRHTGNPISSTNLVNDLLHNQHIPRPSGYIGAYSPEQRRLRIEKFLEKRAKRVWTRKVKYDVRKNFADSRLRIKGRFVKKEDEDIMRELMSI